MPCCQRLHSASLRAKNVGDYCGLAWGVTAAVFMRGLRSRCRAPRSLARLDHRQDAGSDRRRQARPCLDHRGKGRLGGSEGTSGGTSTTVPLFPPRNPGLAVRLQIRHRRFDSDRSLSALDPCELPELPGFAGVFAFLGLAAPKSRQPAKLPQSANPSPLGPDAVDHLSDHFRWLAAATSTGRARSKLGANRRRAKACDFPRDSLAPQPDCKSAIVGSTPTGASLALTPAIPGFPRVSRGFLRFWGSLLRGADNPQSCPRVPLIAPGCLL